MTRLKKVFRWILIGSLLLVFAGIGGVMWFLWASADVGAAYSAKLMASAVFVAGRTPESVASEELGIIPFLKYTIDREAKTVSAWTVSQRKKTAVYRDGLGVAIAHDGDIEALRKQARPELLLDLNHLAEQPWPNGDAPAFKARPEGIDEARLTKVVDQMFEEPSRFHKRRTRAVLVVYDDVIIAERYAAGYGMDQRWPSWSMGKSILHALYGIAVREGKVDIHAPAPLWPDAGDPRSSITIDMMLRMSSGLAFGEYDFTPPSDLTSMLFLSPDSGGYAARMPLAHPVDTVWAYASGTTNMLSLILRQTYGDDEYYALPYRELFAKIGMRSARPEADASGTFVFSSFLHATARDFARFGLLYMHDGVWQGERILPEGWCAYARTATPTAPQGQYGAHWWLPSHEERAKAADRGVPLPVDAFHASGFEGQTITVLPSRKLVVVRLGLAYFSAVSPYNHVCDILETLPSATQ